MKIKMQEVQQQQQVAPPQEESKPTEDTTAPETKASETPVEQEQQ